MKTLKRLICLVVAGCIYVGVAPNKNFKFYFWCPKNFWSKHKHQAESVNILNKYFVSPNSTKLRKKPLKKLIVSLQRVDETLFDSSYLRIIQF